MSRKETDLQKVITELKSTLKDQDIEDLKDQLLSSTDNINDLLKQGSLQDTLQSLLKNKNITNLLQSKDLQEKLNGLMGSSDSNSLMDQLQSILKEKNSEKKK